MKKEKNHKQKLNKESMNKQKKIKMNSEELLVRFEHLNCIRGQQVLQMREDPDLFREIYLIKDELKRRLNKRENLFKIKTYDQNQTKTK
jgi:hypothetical protein